MVAIVIACGAFFSARGQEIQGSKFTLADLAWLSGCWEGGEPEKVRNEMWTKVAGNGMFGIGRLVSKDKTFEFEYMRIHLENEAIVFTAKPSGQAETSFKLVNVKDNAFIFENPQHDFPQRVIYRKEKNGSLAARIEGERNGKIRGIDFPYRRTDCN